jgi:hypothetical protein
MGQTIEIDEAIPLGDILLVSTDRSITGQDGDAYVPGGISDANPIFPAQLAQRLFKADPKVDHVYIMSNTLSIRRTGGWDDTSIDVARQTVSSFFRFYRTDQTDGESS